MALELGFKDVQESLGAEDLVLVTAGIVVEAETGEKLNIADTCRVSPHSLLHPCFLSRSGLATLAVVGAVW